MPEVKAGYWWAKNKLGVSKIQIIEIDENLKNCWPVGCAEWDDLDQWTLLKYIPSFTDD